MTPNDDVHVMPSDGADVIIHESHINCACMPQLDQETKNLETRVWIHRMLKEEAN